MPPVPTDNSAGTNVVNQTGVTPIACNDALVASNPTNTITVASAGVSGGNTTLVSATLPPMGPTPAVQPLPSPGILLVNNNINISRR